MSIRNVEGVFIPWQVDISKVKSVYSGINGKCCCGCAGKHYYTKEYQEQAGKERGYAVTDDEVNDRMVKKVVNFINQHPELQDYNEDDFVSAVKGNRLYTAYYKGS